MNDKKILVIDDDPLILDIYARKFKDEHMAVRCIADTEATTDSVREYAPSLILLDIAMPHKNGLTILQELKENPATKAIKVILLTNNAGKDDVQRGLSLGADDYILKVIHTPGEVVEKVKKFLR